MAAASTPPEPTNESGGEEEPRSDPDDRMSRAERRAEEKVRKFRRDLRGYAAKGVAFELGKEAFKEILRHLTDN